MNTLNKQKVALTAGLFLGGLHVLWSVLVALGVAQSLINFVFWAHMIHMDYVIGPFEPMAAGMLVVVTFLVGYVFGFIFAHLWNWLHRA